VRKGSEAERHPLRERAGEAVARRYRSRLTLASLAAELASSPRQIQRAYELSGETFAEDLRATRLRAAAELLAGQPGIPVAAVARLVGYRRSGRFARAFEQRYGFAPSDFRIATLIPAGSAPAGGPERPRSAPRHP